MICRVRRPKKGGNYLDTHRDLGSASIVAEVLDRYRNGATLRQALREDFNTGRTCSARFGSHRLRFERSLERMAVEPLGLSLAG